MKIFKRFFLKIKSGTDSDGNGKGGAAGGSGNGEENNQDKIANIPKSHFESSPESVLHLIDIYHSEWQYRDGSFWKQAISYFIAILAFSALPIVPIWNTKTITNIFPVIVFPIIGGVFSVIYLFAMIAYLQRIRFARDSFDKLMDAVPKEYRLITYETARKKKNGELQYCRFGKWLFKIRIGRLLVIAFFLCLLAVNVITFILVNNNKIVTTDNYVLILSNSRIAI